MANSHVQHDKAKDNHNFMLKKCLIGPICNRRSYVVLGSKIDNYSQNEMKATKL